jgi:hypothetical protein
MVHFGVDYIAAGGPLLRSILEMAIATARRDTATLSSGYSGRARSHSYGQAMTRREAQRDVVKLCCGFRVGLP